MTDELDLYPDAPGAVAGNGPSQDAAASMVTVARTMRAEAERRLLLAGRYGLTSDELEWATGWRHQTASARLRELVLTGRAVDTDQRRITSSGRTAGVRVHVSYTEGE